MQKFRQDCAKVQVSLDKCSWLLAFKIYHEVKYKQLAIDTDQSTGPKNIQHQKSLHCDIMLVLHKTIGESKLYIKSDYAYTHPFATIPNFGSVTNMQTQLLCPVDYSIFTKK